MLTPPRVRRRFQGAGGFGPLSVRFCARFSANMRTWANTLCSRVRGESCHRLRKRVLNHRIIACCGRRTTAVFARGVLCTFWPQKVPKTPRQMPPLTSSRLTFETGARLKGGFKGRWAAERVISDTTLSLLKPASYAGARAFSRAFVSRLRHRAGIVRRGTRREEVQNGPFRNLKPRFLTGRRTGRRAGRSCQSQCKSRFLTGRTCEHANMGEHPMFACSRVRR